MLLLTKMSSFPPNSNKEFKNQGKTFLHQLQLYISSIVGTSNIPGLSVAKMIVKWHPVPNCLEILMQHYLILRSQTPSKHWNGAEVKWGVNLSVNLYRHILIHLRFLKDPLFSLCDHVPMLKRFMGLYHKHKRVSQRARFAFTTEFLRTVVPWSFSVLLFVENQLCFLAFTKPNI